MALRGIGVVTTWLNAQQVTEQAIFAYRQTLLRTSPRHVVIDDLFDAALLQKVCAELRQNQQWQPQKHSYSALYVKEAKWQKTPEAERFVKRDVWQRPAAAKQPASIAAEFLQYLRGDEFLALLSQIFAVELTDRNVANPQINCNYFRLSPTDFVNQHADDSPGREVCMLLYLNENWSHQHGGELVFSGKFQQPVRISPLYNRCVLFDPSSKGSEHWVNAVHGHDQCQLYRYNVTSWYWSE